MPKYDSTLWMSPKLCVNSVIAQQSLYNTPVLEFVIGLIKTLIWFDPKVSQENIYHID